MKAKHPDFPAFQTKVDQTYNLRSIPAAVKLIQKERRLYPTDLRLEYLEAVFLAEDAPLYGVAETEKRYRRAAKTLRRILYSIRLFEPKLRRVLKNEYYWFSRQPRKQYKLGVTEVGKGNKRGYYSMGVGASEIAGLYHKQGREKLMLKWAKISERAWLNYFKVVPNWYNSYVFYARALGFQGRLKEMENALRKGAKIGKRPVNSPEFKWIRDEMHAKPKKRAPRKRS